VRWFPIAFLAVSDMEFSFSSWWAAVPNLVPHHKLHPAPWHGRTGC